MCISAFQRLSCKIVNLYDIDLKYLGSISDVNNNNLKTFCEVTMSRNYIFRKQANMRPSPINFWILCPQESLTSGTYFMVIRLVLSDINEELRARKSSKSTMFIFRLILLIIHLSSYIALYMNAFEYNLV